MKQIFALLILIVSVSGYYYDDYITDDSQFADASQLALTPIDDRNLDLSPLDDFLTSIGVNGTELYLGNVAPENIVNQFVLSLTVQIFSIIGYIILGIIYNHLVERASPGPFLDFLNYFGPVLTPQGIGSSVSRSLLSLIWEIISRLLTTSLLFGIFETVNKILGSLSFDAVFNFISSEILKRIIIMRFAFGTFFQIIGFSALFMLGMVLNGDTALARDFGLEDPWQLIGSTV